MIQSGQLNPVAHLHTKSQNQPMRWPCHQWEELPLLFGMIWCSGGVLSGCRTHRKDAQVPGWEVVQEGHPFGKASAFTNMVRIT